MIDGLTLLGLLLAVTGAVAWLLHRSPMIDEIYDPATIARHEELDALREEERRAHPR